MKDKTIANLNDIKELADSIIKELSFCDRNHTLMEIDRQVRDIKEDLDYILKIKLDLG
jgi:hypothetical protein